MFDIDVVTRHADLASLKPMQWGMDDCCMFVRNIVLDCGGPDILTAVPAYRTKQEAEKVLSEFGGLIPWAYAQAKTLGVKEAPRPFSNGKLIGIVPTKYGPALALRVKGHWIVRAEIGFIAHPDDMCVVAWEIENA